MDKIYDSREPTVIDMEYPKKVGPEDRHSKIASDTPFRRFERSMVIDYEKWHDGIGYDLEALDDADEEELKTIEIVLINHHPLDWRDIEALARLDTSRARDALRSAIDGEELEIQLSVLMYSPQLVSDIEYTEILIRALRTTKFYGGLTQALDLVADFHPPEVVTELHRGVLEREGEVAVHFAAMLLFINGRSDDPFDMDQRPFFLKFNTEDATERREAYRELCRMIG